MATLTAIPRDDRSTPSVHQSASAAAPMQQQQLHQQQTTPPMGPIATTSPNATQQQQNPLNVLVPFTGSIASAQVASPSSSSAANYSNPSSAQMMGVAAAQASTQRQHIDVYSQLGMQRLGQMYKLNNNYSGHKASSASLRGNGGVLEDLTTREENIQQIIESALRYVGVNQATLG